MAWDEIKKVNSDFINEPLNFNNYINDISTFGAYSYVLDVENKNLWHDLIKNSLTMFGHDSIHDTVLNRFTDDDVDVMITGNGRLGQAFNSFYSTDKFASGNIDKVLKELTPEAYNILDQKFQYGINRYISNHTTADVGTWFTSVFGIDMSTYATMDDILSDTDFWNNTVMSNESLRFVISLSVSSAEYIAGHTESAIYTSFIEMVAQSTDATMTLINALAGTSQLDTFFANETVCTTIANSEYSMTAICYNLAGFSAMIASEIAITIVASSEVAVNVIMDAYLEVTNAETKLISVKEHLSGINDDISTIAMGETVVDDIADTKATIEACVTKIQGVTSQSDILAENITALVSNTEIQELLMSNETSVNSIVNNWNFIVELLTNPITNTLWGTNSDFINRVINRWSDTKSVTKSTSITIYFGVTESSMGVGTLVENTPGILISPLTYFNDNYGTCQAASKYTINDVPTNLNNKNVPLKKIQFCYYRSDNAGSINSNNINVKYLPLTK